MYKNLKYFHFLYYKSNYIKLIEENMDEKKIKKKIFI